MKNIKKILKDPRTYYVIALLAIFLYPPMSEFYLSGRNEFVGWYFIEMLDPSYHVAGRSWRINIPYIAIEFFIISVIYFIYRKKD